MTCPAFRVGCGPGWFWVLGYCGLVCFDSEVSDLVWFWWVLGVGL